MFRNTIMALEAERGGSLFLLVQGGRLRRRLTPALGFAHDPQPVRSKHDEPHAFLLFDGNCAEAMSFYQPCLGGELTLTKVADTPMKDQVPPERHQKIINSHLKSGALEFAATDWMHPTRAPSRGNMVCMYINGGTYSELRAIFDKLSAAADPALLDDLRDLPFGSYGHLADKYGVHWFFRGEPKQGA